VFIKLCAFADCAVMTFPTHFVDQLRDVDTAEDEILILGDLLFAINNSADSAVHESNLEQLVEGEVFESTPAQTAVSSRTLMLYIDDNCTCVNSLNYLVAYVFERRFGWSESDGSGVVVSDGGQHRPSVVRRPTVGGNVDLSKSLVEDLRCKSQINESLDKLIGWYLLQFKICLMFVCMYAVCLLLMLFNSQLDFVIIVIV